MLGGAEGEEFRHLLHGVFGLPEDVDQGMVELLESYMHLTFEPVTSQQPYKFGREYCKNLLEKGMEAKMLMFKKMFQGKNVNIWDAEHTGVAFLGRINFGLGSILTTLGTEGNFREMVAAMG